MLFSWIIFGIFLMDNIPIVISHTGEMHTSLLSWISRCLCNEHMYCLLVCLMVFNATCNNISVISWMSVLLVEKTTNLSQVTDKLFCKMLYTSPWSRFELTTSSMIDTDCKDNCKSNYHAYDHSHDGPWTYCKVAYVHEKHYDTYMYIMQWRNVR